MSYRLIYGYMDAILALVVLGLFALIFFELRSRKWARDGLRDLREQGFIFGDVCDFGDVKIAFDHEKKIVAFVNIESKIPDSESPFGFRYFRGTLREPYSNLKQLRVERGRIDVNPNAYKHLTARITFHAPNSWNSELQWHLVLSSPGRSEIDKLERAWPTELEVYDLAGK